MKEQLSDSFHLNLYAALPEKFEFYHLGQVKRVDPKVETTELESDLIYIGFRIMDEVPVTLVLAFEASLEQGTQSSMQAELGNIIASKFAARLQKENRFEVMISPPIALTYSKILKLLSSGPQPVITHYLHQLPSRTQSFEIKVVILSNTEEFSYV